MEKNNDLAIVLAAGRGSRLKINYPKSLFEIDNISIIQRISEQLTRAGSIDMLTVVGYQKEKIIKHLNKRSAYITQNDPRGTGDAVLRCLHHIKNYRNIFILVGDAPFVSSSHISKLRKEHRESKSECSFLYSKFPFSIPYGRLKFSKSRELLGLVEACSASDTELEIRDMFTSQYLFNSENLCRYLVNIKPNRITGEYNLTDIINIYLNNGLKVHPILIKSFWSLMGINREDDVKKIQKYMNK